MTKYFIYIMCERQTENNRESDAITETQNKFYMGNKILGRMSLLSCWFALFLMILYSTLVRIIQYSKQLDYVVKY